MREKGRQVLDGRRLSPPIHCEECTIQIGDGYQESIAFDFVEDESTPRPRVMKVCWRCWESLTRRKLRRQALSDAQPPSVID
jgi:hypothetical protein